MRPGSPDKCCASGDDAAQGRHAPRQILYVSLSSVPGDRADLHGILQQSRHNNAIEGITGLLWSDGRSFMQVLEGPRAGVDLVFGWIRADPRHHSLTILSDRHINTHEFGGWNMAHRRAGDAPDAYDAMVARLLSKASEPVRVQFFTLISTRQIVPSLSTPQLPA